MAEQSDYSVETRRRVYNDTTGDFIEVCPDAYTPQTMLEIRNCDADGKVVQRVVIPVEAVPLVMGCVGDVLTDIRESRD